MEEIHSTSIHVRVYNEAKNGNRLSGDTYYIAEHPNFFLCAIADGLGNGPVAKESADVIPEILEEYANESIDQLLERCNSEMTYKRGAAVALVKIDYVEKTLSYSCVGNVKFYMYQKRFDKMVYPLPVMGYLSGRKQTLKTQTYPVYSGDVFLLHSDGVDIRNPKGLLKASSSADQLYTHVMQDMKFGDDATFIAATYHQPEE